MTDKNASEILGGLARYISATTDSKPSCPLLQAIYRARVVLDEHDTQPRHPLTLEQIFARKFQEVWVELADQSSFKSGARVLLDYYHHISETDPCGRFMTGLLFDDNLALYFCEMDNTFKIYDTPPRGNT